MAQLSVPSFLANVQSSSNSLPLHASIQIQLEVASVNIRALWWPPPSPDPFDGILIFITGNPGLPAFYIDFLSSLRQQVPRNLAILACGHLGHDHVLSMEDREFTSLHFQVEAALQVLRKVQKEMICPVYLMGHSIGAWVAMQVASRSENVQLVLALQPTISHMVTTPNGRVLWPLFTPPVPAVLSPLAAFLACYFPFILSILFIQWPKSQRSTLANFLSSSRAVYSSLTMAQDEMTKVTQLDTDVVSKLASRLRIVYSSSGDHWVGNNHIEVINAIGADLAMINVKMIDVPHAFCILHNEEMVNACKDWLMKP